MSHGDTNRDSSWLAIGPSASILVPLAREAPTWSLPGRAAAVGRGTDPGWSTSVSRQHGEVVATKDGHVWFRDFSAGGTYRHSDKARLEYGKWTDVTDQDLCLGSPLVPPGGLLRFKNIAEQPAASTPKSDTKPKALAKPRKPTTPMKDLVVTPTILETQAVERGDAIANPSWEGVPEHLHDAADDMLSRYVVTMGETTLPLPYNGRPIPFGSDPSLGERRGLVVPSRKVSRLHGFVRFNPLGGPLRPDGSRAGSLQIYDGNGQGRPSTNHIFCQSPGQPIGYPIPPGLFHTFTLDDIITFADVTVVVTSVETSRTLSP